MNVQGLGTIPGQTALGEIIHAFMAHTCIHTYKHTCMYINTRTCVGLYVCVCLVVLALSLPVSLFTSS